MELQTLQAFDETSYQSTDGTHYPGISQQILVDLSSVTRQISGLELREGNRISRKSGLHRTLGEVGREEDAISQLVGLVSWNQLVKNGAISQKRLDTVLKDIRE